MSDRIFILGAGRAGRGLARALRASGIVVVGLHGRTADPASGVTAGALPREFAHATAVLVTVRDSQLEDALGQVALAPLGPGTVVLHASGSLDPAALTAVRALGHPSGTFHPLVPLAGSARAGELLRGSWIGVDGDPAAVAVSRRLATALGAGVLEIPAGEKARYHAAAVIASNFPAVLAAVAIRLLRDTGVPEEEAWPAIVSLMGAAASNLLEREPAAALTGPVVRGDSATIARHVEALATNPEALEMYRAVSKAAVSLAAQAGTDAAALEEIAALLDR